MTAAKTTNSPTTVDLSRLGPTVIACLYVAWALIYIHGTSVLAVDGNRYFSLFDDAMISMRYAWNLSHGNGLVWNPGELVEGYTNLLMVLLMSVATLALDKSHAVLAIQVLAIPTVLGVAWGSVQLWRQAITKVSGSQARLSEIAVFAGILLYYPLSFWSLTGMETGLLALLLVTAVTASLRFAATRRLSSAVVMSCALGLAFLTRNDSLLYAAVIFAYAAIRVGKSSSAGHLLTALGIYLLFVIAQQAFRYSYYHAWVPNTYTLKLTGMGLQDRLRNGIIFILPFLLQTSPLLLLGIWGGTFAGNRDAKILVVLFGVSMLYQVYVGGEPWPRWRMMSALAPVFWPAVVSGCRRLGTEMASHIGARRPLAAALLAGGLIFADAPFWPEISLRDRPNPDGPAQVNAAVAVAALTDESATVGVFHAGILPYYTGRPALDYLGKTDSYIAQLAPHFLPSEDLGALEVDSPPGHNKYDLDYSIRHFRPTYSEGFEWYDDSVETWAQRHYVEVTYDSIDIYLLRDSPAVRWDMLPVDANR